MDIKEIISKLSKPESCTPKRVEELLLTALKGPTVIPLLQLAKGAYVYRVSIIEDMSELKSYKRLSYKPAHMNDTYQRASTPSNTMFYGIVADSYVHALMACMGETCDCLRIENSPHKHYNIVASIWELKSDVALVQMLDIKGNNKSYEFGNTNELQNCISEYNSGNVQKNELFLEFIGNEFRKKATQDADYWVSAIYTEILTQNLRYPGIVYESVQAVDSSLTEVHCVAFTPEFTDSQLNFVKAVQYEFDYEGIDQVLHPIKVKEFTFNKNDDSD